MASKILESSDPKIQKELGRRVRNFDPSVWSDHCDDIVKLANYIKVCIHVICTIMVTQKGTMYVQYLPLLKVISLSSLQQVDVLPSTTEPGAMCIISYIAAACTIKLIQCLHF